ncbi:MAG TPA: 3-hydroxyacyl-CoA dehydrogenase NAD-binding domain-containing protein, partial [Vicinamibacterales bacterium]|nr:3-hydroxyacyl-CoA dehydrogenase NAD-binding domain-containing protein [Vicinamibacterales bacterium]
MRTGETRSRGAIRALGVIGAGNMGSGIAQKMATEGFDVVLVDVADEKVARGLSAIDRTLKEAVDRGIMRADRAIAIRDRIHGTSRFDDLRDSDLVVEAVFEDLALKRDVFRQLESVCRSDAILATNTSSFLVGDVAEALQRPGRALGLHYFFHPAKNRLVEVIPGRYTDRRTFEQAWAVQEQLGKIPIESRDASGFVVNRFFVVWLMEAIRLLDERIANAITIDEIAKRTFSVGMGPFELMNVSGVPIALHASTTIGNAFGALYGPSDLLRRQVESGEPWSLGGTVDTSAAQSVSDRLTAGVFLAASSLVAEGIGTKEDVDIGARVGLRWTQGPFEMMNTMGTAHALELTTMLAARWRMQVPAPLVKRGTANVPLPIELVKWRRDAGVATITVNRPDVMNALNETVGRQLEDVFARASNDVQTTGIVIAGAGRSFVAGADIRFFIRCIEQNDIARVQKLTEALQALLTAIQDCPKPVAARVHGLALGGGVELALACDYIIATPNASFGFPETGIGIYPGLGGTQRTTRRIGTGLTKWLVFTGEIVSADEALAIGLIDAVAPREELDEAVFMLLAGGPAKERRPVQPSGVYRKIADFFDSHDVERIRNGGANTGGDERLEKAMRVVGTKAPAALTIASELIGEGFRVPLQAGLQMELS